MFSLSNKGYHLRGPIFLIILMIIILAWRYLFANIYIGVKGDLIYNNFDLDILGKYFF